MDDSECDDIGDITGAQLHHELTKGKDSAGGLDGWTNRDLGLTSEFASTRLAHLLNAIEGGAPWPLTLLQARSVFLAKDPADLDDCLKYR
eukprot:3936280-Heterocapsa_arctica.AAC.1